MPDTIVPGKVADAQREIARLKRRLRLQPNDRDMLQRAINRQQDIIDRALGQGKYSATSRATELRKAAATNRQLASDAPTDRAKQLNAEADRWEAQASKLTPVSDAGLADVNRADREAAAPPPSGPDLSDPATVRYIQTALKNAGYYHGRIDGIWGPQSQAANVAYQVGQGQAAPDAAAPSTPTDVPTGGGGAAAPAVGAGPVRAGGASAAPYLDDAGIRTKFPELAAFLDVPGLGDVIRSAAQNGDTPDQLRVAVEQTDWWKTHNPTQRAWIATLAVDPAAAQQQILDTRAKLRQSWQEYLPSVPLSDTTLDEWGRKLLAGEIPSDGWDQHVKELAKSAFPSIAASIDQGFTTKQVYEPYRQLAASRLEINPDQVDLADPKWARALTTIDPKTGQPTLMSLYDWERELKTNTAYGYDRTQQARGQATSLISDLGKIFGKVAS